MDLHGISTIAQRAIDVGSPIVERLDNGALVVLNHVDGAPGTTLRLGTAHGSLQDPVGKAGAAHVSEHMLFDTSPVRTNAEIRGLRRELGGDSNGLTNQDRVWIQAHVPTSEADRALALIGDIYTTPSRDARLLEHQRGVIHRELQYNYADRERHAAMHLRSLLYGDGSLWARFPLGRRSTIDRVGIDDHLRWIDDAVTGANTVALVDGDLRRTSVRAFTDRLAALPAGVRTPNPRFDGFAPGGAWSTIEHSGRATVALDVAFPQLPGDRQGGLGLVQETLGERLRTRLREQDGLLYGVDMSGNPGPEGSAIVARLIFDPRDVRAGVAAVAHEAQSLAAGIPASELAQARAFTASKQAMAAPTGSSQALDAWDNLVNANDVGDDLLAEAGLRAHSGGSKSVSDATVAATAADVLRPERARYLLSGSVGDGGQALLDGLRDAGVAPHALREQPFPYEQYRRELELTGP